MKKYKLKQPRWKVLQKESIVLNYLCKKSGIAKILKEDNTLTLEELLMSYCITQIRFKYIVKLLGKLCQFENEKLKLSNCLLDNTLPYNSFVGVNKFYINILYELTDYLDLPNTIREKILQVKNNWISCNKYISGFNPLITLHWSAIGDIRGLKWALASGSEWSTQTSAVAAEKGHLGYLKWLHKNGCPWNVTTCQSAAREGQLKCLQYAYYAGCPLSYDVASAAALNGHFHCLWWLYTIKCPIDKWTIKYALRHFKPNSVYFNFLTSLRDILGIL